MGIFLRRPSSVSASGNWNGAGFGGSPYIHDNNDNTYIQLDGSSWFNEPGRLTANFPALAAGNIPAGRKIVANRIAGRQSNSNGRDGYPEFYLRSGTTRLANSRLYDTVRNTSWHTVWGPWVYRSGNTAYPESEVNALTAEINYVGDSSQLSEVWIDTLYDEPLTAPTAPYPANAATIDTSSVSFSAQAPAPQAGQLVRGVFQVARDSAFTSGVKTFYGSWHDRTGATERATYTSNWNDATNTDLGPGLWYMRVQVQDVVGNLTAWSATTTFTIAHAALPAPINTVPAPGSIKTDPYGIRSARVDTAASDNRTVGAEWQYSKVNTFASGVVTWKNTNAAYRVTTGTVSYNAQPKAGTTALQYGYDVSPDDVSQYLSQGTWYVRSRTVDKWNQVSAWSATDSFTVSHPPQAQNIMPASNQVVDQNVTPVRWTFGDPWNGDAQTAYQVKVYDANNALIYDSTKLSSTSLQHFLAISNTYLYQVLHYTVNLWDKDDVTASTVASNYYVFSTSPAIVQSTPAQNATVATGQPTFAWNPGINRPGTKQRSFELKVYRQDNNALVYTSGEVISTATTHTPPQVILRNGVAYLETLRIVDSDGLSSTLTRNFTASYQSPPEPIYSVDPSPYYLSGYAHVEWESTVPDDYFVAWKIYRRETGTAEWDLIYTEEDSAVKTFHDWLVPSVGEYEWAVTQLADRSGFILESGLPDAPASYHIETEDYWLIVDGDESKNIKLYSVTDDKFTDEIEMNEYVVKGRGRRVNYGTVIGMNGSLSVQLRHNSNMTAREQRLVLKDLQLQQKSCLLRDPFGNITRIAIGNISVTRVAGVGNMEFADVEIPYLEVF